MIKFNRPFDPRTIQLVIFDLDGTLIDSRLDLVHSVNATLRHMKRPELPDDVIASYVGDGAPALIGRALGSEAGDEKLVRSGLVFAIRLSSTTSSVLLNLRVAGIRLADLREYSYDRRDVTARALANAYASLSARSSPSSRSRTRSMSPFAEVGDRAEDDQLYRLSYDGTIVDEPEFLVMGGQAETLTTEMKRTFAAGQNLKDAPGVAVTALGSVGGTDGAARPCRPVSSRWPCWTAPAESAKFRRVTGQALTQLLPASHGEPEAEPAPADTPRHDLDDDPSTAD